MSSIVRRLQRENKLACKFHYTVIIRSVELSFNPLTQHKKRIFTKSLSNISNPTAVTKVKVVFSRRNRTKKSEARVFQPDIIDQNRGSIRWSEESDGSKLEIYLTLQESKNGLPGKTRTFLGDNPFPAEFEPKDYKISLVEVSRNKVLACGKINMAEYADERTIAHQIENLELTPTNKRRVTNACISMTIGSMFLKSGSAADEDMHSLASLLSIRSTNDFANLHDFDDETFSSDHGSKKDTESLKGEMRSVFGEISRLTNSFGPKSLESSPVHSFASMQPDENLAFRKSLIKTPRIKAKTLSLRKPFNESCSIAFEQSSRVLQPAEKEAEPVKLAKEIEIMNWAKERTNSFKNVNITNFTTSWRNGLAFCALYKSFDAGFEYNDLDRADAEKNLKTAFGSFYKKFRIQKLLYPSDLLKTSKIDKLKVLTYLSLIKDIEDHGKKIPSRTSSLAEWTKPHKVILLFY